MAKCRRKVVELDYVRWDGRAETANAFLGNGYGIDWYYEAAPSTRIVIPSRKDGAKMVCDVGDYIIRGTANEVWACEGETFPHYYDTAEA